MTPFVSSRFLAFSVGCVLASLTGCGGGSTNEASSSAQAKQTQQPVAQTQLASAEPTVPSTDVVSQFLDLVRRGGEDSGAASLLTQKAQAELKRIGRGVQPIGTPDAKYEVTRSESVAGDPNSALVHSRWTEPNANPMEVVWAVQKEEAGWRISGLVMEIDPSQPPMIINFEDGNGMAKLLGDSEDAEAAAGSAAQATLDNDTLAR